MTVVVTLTVPGLIAMTVDSAVTLQFENRREYTKGRKAYPYEGMGCVTTWGARDGNRIGEFLDKPGVREKISSVDDLAEQVNVYLTEWYKPRELVLS